MLHYLKGKKKRLKVKEIFLEFVIFMREMNKKNFDKIGIVTKLGRIEESKLNFFFLFLLIPLSRYMN